MILVRQACPRTLALLHSLSISFARTERNISATNDLDDFRRMLLPRL